MNPNLSLDDTSHDIEIIVQLLLKIQIQTEPNPSETPESQGQVSHLIKDISIVKIESI
jgi:hypothetical protein